MSMVTSETNKEFFDKDLRCNILNGSSPTMTNSASEVFIGLIRNELSKGLGFVPLIGAGFSAPSGIPLVNQLKVYLQRCICMALGAEDRHMRPWNPRTDSWPPFIDRTRPEPRDTSWMVLVENELRYKRENNPMDRDLPVYQEGYGNMAEWRAALLFLSRLIRNPEDSRSMLSGRLSLGTPRQEIIDACFREVLKGKQPTLNHHMLTALVGLLRIDVILSTNFDDLLEKAFEASRNSLEVFEVHLEGTLPDWSAVSRVLALVKLHGSRYLMRADYSLDDNASEPDKQRFLEYLKGSSLDATEEIKLSNTRNHLLVMGVSARERRTCSFIKHAWKYLEDLKVYWVCYTEEDVANVKQFTEACYPSNDRELSIIVRHTEIGFLLLHLYQSIRKNIPPAGTVFPSPARVALPPLPFAGIAHSTNSARIKRQASLADRLIESLKVFGNEEYEGYRLVTTTSESFVHGVTSACASVFRKLENSNTCLWIDMNDISSTDNFFEVLLEAAYLKLGLENWTPVFMESDARPRAAEIRRLAASGNQPWVIFLNARETPGTNASRHPRDADGENGWIDTVKQPSVEKGKDTSAWTRPFVELLQELSSPHKPRISVVLLCHGLKPYIAKVLSAYLRISKPLVLDESDPDYTEFKEVEVTSNVLLWTTGLSIEGISDPPISKSEREARQWFLNGLVLFQRSRLPATIWDACMRVPGTSQSTEQEQEQDKASIWLEELAKFHLLRHKPGGYIWVHARCRETIREALRHDGVFAELPTNAKKVIDGWKPAGKIHEIHARIAAWYSKLLDATDSPAAVFEAADHHCRAAEAILMTGSDGAVSIARAQLNAASSLLHANALLIQTHGYSRGSCRRLEFLRDFMTKDNLRAPARSRWEEFAPQLLKPIQRLKIVCTDVMRAIAREVGEDAKAYQRNCQLRQLVVHPDSDPICAKYPSQRELGKALQRAALEKPDSTSLVLLYCQWLRSWRWYGMLGIASRSARTENSLSKALYYASKKPSVSSFGYTTTIRRFDQVNLEQLKVRLRSDDLPPVLAVEILRIIEEAAAALLLRERSLWRFHLVSDKEREHLIEKWAKEAKKIDFDMTLLDKSSDPKRRLKKVQKRLQHVGEVIDLGLTLASNIAQLDNSEDFSVTNQAMWAKNRLLIHKSVLESCRLISNPANSDASMSILGDAQSCLRISDPRRYRADLGMVDLHRADCKLIEANAKQLTILISKVPTEVSFREMSLLLFRNDLTPSPNPILDVSPEDIATKLISQNLALKSEYFGEGHEGNTGKLADSLSYVRALAEDAMRFLDRAEIVLRQRRRNVWWTTWYFERKLRTIATLVWCSILETEKPIPFLGLEAAMRKTETIADILLTDAIRMIRVDCYRLATVIEAYALCIRGLQLRLMWDHCTPRLPGRLSAMCERLAFALKELGAAMNRRKNTGVEGKYSYDLGIMERIFIDQVEIESNAVLEALKDWLLIHSERE